MVEWSDQERAIIGDIFKNVDYADIGPKALRRCLIVYPWTQRYFEKFGDLSTPELIKTNKNVEAHGVTVLRGLNKAACNLGNIKKSFTELSTLHSDTLNVDPDNFKLLSDCFTIVIAGKMGAAFRPEIQVTLQKFLAVVVSALGRQYW